MSSASWTPPDLRGTVAVVTGASRGAGRAIAAVLGETGATVYVTGRSVRGAATTEGLPGTIEETAEEVTRRGGVGVAVRCDHTVDADVESLVARVRREQRHLDLLVNNAWGGYEAYDPAAFSAPFWVQPRTRWEAMFTAGVRAHLVMSQLAAPLLIGRSERGRPGLVASTIAWAFGEPLGNLFYNVAKAALVRMAYVVAEELRPYRVASVAIAPGFMRTERVLAAHAAQPFDLSATESPEYVGRALAALAGDPELMRRSGQVLTAGDLAREYGFTDVDGGQPAAFRIAPPSDQG
ncbi:MAG TPA: SDR family NAD(P)-dependent oxidoreductase [Candidatus Dormibacteraeota bacterium]|nr:SDR family NAD(P)-dependent oxidoreductase [Candidatus Dormibacteraeota bacterium]